MLEMSEHLSCKTRKETEPKKRRIEERKSGEEQKRDREKTERRWKCDPRGLWAWTAVALVDPSTIIPPPELLHFWHGHWTLCPVDQAIMGMAPLLPEQCLKGSSPIQIKDVWNSSWA